jgi:glutamyl-tRNA synthetase
MIAWFDLGGIGRSPARFDFAKLENLSGHYIRATDDDALYNALLDTAPYLPGGPEFLAQLTPELRQQLRQAMPGLKERAKTLVELIDGATYLTFKRPLPIDEAARKLLDPNARAHLQKILPALRAVDPWAVPGLEGVVRGYAEANGLKLGQIAQPIRAAVTGRTTSPGIFDVLVVLGRNESLARISDQASQ